LAEFVLKAGPYDLEALSSSCFEAFRCLGGGIVSERRQRVRDGAKTAALQVVCQGCVFAVGHEYKGVNVFGIKIDTGRLPTDKRTWPKRRQYKPKNLEPSCDPPFSLTWFGFQSVNTFMGGSPP
jgi:hypothetical protein